MIEETRLSEATRKAIEAYEEARRDVYDALLSDIRTLAEEERPGFTGPIQLDVDPYDNSLARISLSNGYWQEWQDMESPLGELLVESWDLLCDVLGDVPQEINLT